MRLNLPRSALLLGAASVVTSILVACSPSTTAKDDANMKDITDRSGCTGAPVSGNSINDSWQMLQTTETKTGTANLTFSVQADTINANFTMINSCSTPTGTNLVAKVTVPAAFTPNTISLLSGGTKSVSNGTTNCSLNVQAGTIGYRLVGNCIQLNYNGKPLTLVHE